MRKLPLIALVLVTSLAGGLALAKAKKKPADDPAPPPPPADDLIDVSAAKGKLKVAGDGKGHYMAWAPFYGSNVDDAIKEFVFWGDGKDFWQQRTIGYGAEGDIKFDLSFWEPRVQERWKAEFDFKDKKYSVTCDDRVTTLTLMTPADADKLLADAKFHKPRWKHQAYSIARDTKGTYFYVDRQREPEGSKIFRVFSGQKGAMTQLKLTNIVSDSEGDIFSTKKGDLRLVLDKSEQTWTKGKKQTKLTVLPVEDNIILIYSELGVYTGQSLGTPCDDI